jgi:hypothetical protein
MSAIRLGDAVFVGFPNEVFTEIGLWTKQQSPFEKTFVLGVCAGHGGYIPTEAEFLEGGYAANGSPFGRKAGQAVIDHSLELINRVQ